MGNRPKMMMVSGTSVELDCTIGVSTIQLSSVSSVNVELLVSNYV
jgi:hypothetical protein